MSEFIASDSIRIGNRLSEVYHDDSNTTMFEFVVFVALYQYPSDCCAEDNATYVGLPDS